MRRPPRRFGRAAKTPRSRRLRAGAFDVLDYVVRTAPTLRVAVQRLGRYNRLEHDVAEFTLHDDGERVRIVHAFRGGRPGQLLGQHRHSIEFTLASLAIIAGLGVQGLTDTIFFRPEVQLIGWFAIAVLAAGDD